MANKYRKYYRRPEVADDKFDVPLPQSIVHALESQDFDLQLTRKQKIALNNLAMLGIEVEQGVTPAGFPIEKHSGIPLDDVFRHAHEELTVFLEEAGLSSPNYDPEELGALDNGSDKERQLLILASWTRFSAQHALDWYATFVNRRKPNADDWTDIVAFAMSVERFLASIFGRFAIG